MSYKLSSPPEDTPRTNEHEFASDSDQHGQICGLVRSKRMRELERDYNALRKALEEVGRLIEAEADLRGKIQIGIKKPMLLSPELERAREIISELPSS